MSSSTSSITVPAFNGSSTFSSSFQTVLANAVNAASLPMQLMQNEVTTLTGQQSALTTLEGDFVSLQGAIASINAATQGSPAATSSNTSLVTANASSDALSGTYSIQVDNAGSSSVALSNAGSTAVTDPTSQNISSSSSFTLTVNGTATTITPSGSSLEDLVTAINGAGAGVSATIVNMGGSSGADYRLVLTSDNLGPDTIQLNDSAGKLMSTLSTGALAEYKVNGSSTDVTSTSSQVTLSPGLTVNIQPGATAGDSATVTVSNDYSGLSSSLSSFVTAYNQAVTDVQAQTGKDAGALSGNSTVYQLENLLDNIAEYSGSGSGSVNSLSALGLDLDSTGQLSFDSSTFSSLNTSDVQTFLGSAATGGFLQMATNAATSATDSSSGIIENNVNTLQTQITNENTLISNQQNMISIMETNLETQLSAADAAITTLQSEKTYFADLFQAEYPSSGSAG
ncbi:MAG: flagellar filament capping protein FliD [Bryobacteraceae bacterium]|jgi:flagellar hook-associated protein 2